MLWSNICVTDDVGDIYTVFITYHNLIQAVGTYREDLAIG
jgi:hypothetical protein